MKAGWSNSYTCGLCSDLPSLQGSARRVMEGCSRLGGSVCGNRRICCRHTVPDAVQKRSLEPPLPTTRCPGAATPRSGHCCDVLGVGEERVAAAGAAMLSSVGAWSAVVDRRGLGRSERREQPALGNAVTLPRSSPGFCWSLAVRSVDARPLTSRRLGLAAIAATLFGIKLTRGLDRTNKPPSLALAAHLQLSNTSNALRSACCLPTSPLSLSVLGALAELPSTC